MNNPGFTDIIRNSESPRIQSTCHPNKGQRSLWLCKIAILRATKLTWPTTVEQSSSFQTKPAFRNPARNTITYPHRLLPLPLSFPFRHSRLDSNTVRTPFPLSFPPFSPISFLSSVSAGQNHSSFLLRTYYTLTSAEEKKRTKKHTHVNGRVL